MRKLNGLLMLLFASFVVAICSKYYFDVQEPYRAWLDADEKPKVLAKQP